MQARYIIERRESPFTAIVPVDAAVDERKLVFRVRIATGELVEIEATVEDLAAFADQLEAANGIEDLAQRLKARRGSIDLGKSGG